MKSELEKAVLILDGLAGDLEGAVLLIKESRRKSIIEETEVSHKHVFRICFTSIFINTSKFVEFCRKYSKLLNEETPELTTIRNSYQESIKKKGIIKFRNDYIGHIHSKSLKRPLTNIENQVALEAIIGGADTLPFLNWIYPDDYETSDRLDSLVGIIEEHHDVLRAKL
ncbi:hypothetical protein [Shewanella gelidii]|uniref:Uncharacterized protein n=1 Tax=Shewanella gelidii TaxID=1642821 RepID=A0A917JH57_9GAMM|nr:hypothetical protein [Shewanella gelidii]MCL1096398.1 hypothetical protein [Shewanella gelidii]GGI67179.1 hypothetical protein GCM10009332_00270 [Shewanella gelidii]